MGANSIRAYVVQRLRVRIPSATPTTFLLTGIPDVNGAGYMELAYRRVALLTISSNRSG